jgi:hypothetical protein
MKTQCTKAYGTQWAIPRGNLTTIGAIPKKPKKPKMPKKKKKKTTQKTKKQKSKRKPQFFFRCFTAI